MTIEDVENGNGMRGIKLRALGSPVCTLPEGVIKLLELIQMSVIDLDRAVMTTLRGETLGHDVESR